MAAEIVKLPIDLITDNPLWRSIGKFDTRTAFIDLLIMDAQKDSEILIVTEAQLAKRWQCSSSYAEKLLLKIAGFGQLKVTKDLKTSTYMITPVTLED